MLCALFASAILAIAPCADPAGAAATVLVARVTPSRLVAVNPSASAQLLVFRDARGFRRGMLALPPHGSLDHALPAGTLDSLTLEVVSRAIPSNGGSPWRTSGELGLREIAAQRYDALWIEAAAGHNHVWGERGESFGSLAPQSERKSDATLHAECESPDPQAVFSAHVPVVTPGDKSKGDLPPRLEKKPLPPI